MRYTLANTAELSVEFGINYISDCDTAPPTLADRVSVQPAEWQHPYSCDTVALLQIMYI